MILAVSHCVIATDDVSRLTRFFEKVFEIVPHFENDQFSEFVLPSKFRVAFFKPVGPASRFFSTKKGDSDRASLSLGITVKEIDKLFEHVEQTMPLFGHSVSGPPKDHPWGEKSFLLIDPDGNRWEVTQSPTESGMLTNRES